MEKHAKKMILEPFPGETSERDFLPSASSVPITVTGPRFSPVVFHETTVVKSTKNELVLARDTIVNSLMGTITVKDGWAPQCRNLAPK